MDEVNKRSKELMLAIEKLQTFSQHNETELIPNVHHLDVREGTLVASENSPLKRTINLMSCFISSLLSEKARVQQEKKKNLVQNEVLHAIGVLRRHYLFIQKLKKGNPQQQQLAAAAIAAVNNYNGVMDFKKGSPSWSGKIVEFLYKQSGLSVDETLRGSAVELPQPAIMQNEAAKQLSQKLQTTSNKAMLCSSYLEIPTQEADAFRVKFISLLKSQGMTVSEQLPTIKATPIQRVAEGSPSIVSMMQTLRPFPGETIVLKGSFLRSTKNSSVPIPDSFHMASESSQTGFPHPSQYALWSLCDQLVPICPLRLDHLVLLQPLYLSKNALAKELLPQGSLNAKAKEILKLKKQAFEKNRDTYLGLLRELNHAMLKAAPKGVAPENALSLIDRFFENKPSYEYLSDIFEIINSHFIEHPHNKLQESWVEGSTLLTHNDPKSRLQAASTILSEEFQASINSLKQTTQPSSKIEQNTLDYIVCMGHLLGIPARTIILQHFSEMIKYSPPALSEYEQRMQIATYKQLMAFHKELNDPLSLDNIKEMFLSHLQHDISLFQDAAFEEVDDRATSMVHELEVYYNSQAYRD